MKSMKLNDLIINEDENTFIITIKESKYNILDGLNTFLKTDNSYIFENLNSNYNEYKLEILLENFVINFYVNEHLVSSVNKNNKFNLSTDYDVNILIPIF